MIDIDRTKNALRNIVWGMIEKISILIFPFITRTILIKTLGAEYLGISSLFTSILQVLSISELGFGSAIVFSMYKPIAENDTNLVSALLNTYRKIYYVIGSIILIAGIVVVPFLPKLIKGELPLGINLYVLYFIYLANTVISYYLFAYKQALFSAYQRNDLISKRASLVSICSSIVQICLLIFFKNYYVYVLVFPLATIATNILNAVLADKMFPDIHCRGHISTDQKKDIKKRIIGLISFKIYSVIFTSVDTIVISAFIGLTPLAIYNNYYYIQSSIVGFLVILTSSITAGVGNKMVTNSKEDNYLDFKRFHYINGWIVSWCAVCLLCLYQPFMKIWVGDELLFSSSTMVLMVLYFFLPRITTLTFTYREAAGLWWEDRFRPIVATVVNLVINIFLVRVIGINGVLISTLMCTIFINVPWGTVILFKNYFKKSPAEYFKQTIFYILITVLAGSVTYGTCSIIPLEGIFGLLSCAVTCCIIPNIIFWMFYHKMKEYDYSKELVVQMVQKLSRK